MSAAITARRHGLTVLVIDEMPQPGGQIWRAVEAAPERDAILGPSYVEGRQIAAEFRRCGAQYRAGTKVWQIEPGFRVFLSSGEKAEIVEAQAIIVAVGAQERPVPFKGWTLPGVLTVGAAQILLKSSGQIPTGPTWIAGCGPLALLYATQLLRAGGSLAGFLDTTPKGQWARAIKYLPSALWSSGELVKGLAWSSTLRRQTRVIRNVMTVEAIGTDRITAIRYRTEGGRECEAEATGLLVHEGVIPNIHATLAFGCDVHWNHQQECYVPSLDRWGESSQSGLFIAGDGAGIGGARAAVSRGALAALRIVSRQQVMKSEVAREGRMLRRRLSRELAIRPFLDVLFKPRLAVFLPDDDAIVCRCEEVTARDIRDAATLGTPGPNQIKAALRTGMGLCQGRQCGYTVTRIIAAAQGRQPSEVGYFNIRPPLKPLSLGELATLDRARNGPSQLQREQLE